MAETKYGKHFIKAPIAPKVTEEPTFDFSAGEYGVDASWVILPVTYMPPEIHEALPTHKHSFHQFITWLGANPRDIGEFDAEMWTCLGEEQEKHIIKSPTVQNLPPGTPHAPGGLTRVDKPMMSLEIQFTAKWGKEDVTVLDVPNRQTEGTKYSKHLIPAPIGPAREGPPVKTLAFSAAEYGVDAGWILVPVLEPRIMQETSHKHDFHQFFCFLGGDPKNIGDFDAEIEVYLGEEGEKHVITSPTVLHIPPGLVHCPMEYKRVDKPVLHFDIFFGSEYKRIPAPR